MYKADYEVAKTPEAKQALAAKLRRAAAEAAEPVNRYVLLKVARDVAARAADVDLAFESADAMAAAYQVEAFGMKFEILETALRSGVPWRLWTRRRQGTTTRPPRAWGGLPWPPPDEPATPSSSAE